MASASGCLSESSDRRPWVRADPLQKTSRCGTDRCVSITLTVCEFASANRDGTFSVFRGGLDVFEAPTLPARFALYLLCGIPSNMFSQGAYPFSVVARHGEHELFSISDGVLTVATQERPFHFALPVFFTVTEYGIVTVTCDVGGHTAEATLDIRTILS